MNSSWRINFGQLCLGVALVILMTRATRLLEPRNLYFSIGGTLFSVPERPAWPAFLIYFFIPVVVGGVIGFIAAENEIETAGAVGFTGAFLVAWPAFANWNDVANQALVQYEYAFKTAYVLFIIAYTFLAMWGARLTVAYLNFDARRRRVEPAQAREFIIRDLLAWESVRNLLYGVIAFVATVLWENYFAALIFQS